MEPKPLVERWADGEPTVAYAIDVPAAVEPDAWVVTAAAPGLGPAVGWFGSDDVAGRQRGLDAGLIGSIVELGVPAGIDVVAATVAAGRYPPLGTRPWQPEDPAPADPVRHRAIANEMLATVLALGDAAWARHLGPLVDLDGVDGLLVRRSSQQDLADLEDLVIECCDAAGLTPGLALPSHGAAVADARAVDQAHALGFGFVVVLAPST